MSSPIISDSQKKFAARCDQSIFMSRFSRLFTPFQALRIFAALMVALALPVAANAQTKDKKKPSRTQASRPASVDEKNLPTTIEAEEMTGRPDREINLDNNVEIVRGQTTITSDKAIYRQEENEVEATGNVRMERFGDAYISDAAELNLDTGAGTIFNPEYRLAISKAQGKAERIDMESEEQTRVINGTYSTCEGFDPDWYLKADTLDIDSGTNIGVAHKSVVYFQDVPIIAVPVMSFPMSSERKSGVLPPTIGMTSKSGLEVSLPYYFNLAPNYDLTLYPKLLARRGLQLGATGRYLERTYSGETKLEVLPDDQERNSTRYAISSVHRHAFAPGWSYSWNLNAASDDNYPDDFGGTTAASSQRLLGRDFSLNYGAEFWSASALVSNYQVLQDVAAPITRPHARLPQLNLRAGRMDVNGFDWEVTSELTRFWLPDSELNGRATGDRYVFRPQISYPVQTPSYFFKPKLSLHASQYNLENWRESSLTRTVPTFSVDSGLIFERNASFFGSPMTQTLEPRLFYVKTPYRDQSDFPNFDSAETTFGFGQIFSENRFAGSDRIADANHLTAAVTSRYIELSGAERMRFTVGQRFYIHDQRVGLDGNIMTSDEKRSDLLLGAGGRLTQNISIDSLLQYDLDTNKIYSANYSMQWKPRPKHVLNAEYRYIRNTLDNPADALGNGLEQVNFSGQWPLGDRWYAVGQVSYSLPQSRTVENLFGFEYNADCWVWRMVAQRYATSTLESNTALFFQLQLNGLSRIGSDPMQALRKTIPGYQPITEAAAIASGTTSTTIPFSQ